MIDWVAANFVLASTILATIGGAVAVVHALLYKEEVRAAIAWVGLIVLVPFVGAILYYLIGVNRIRRRAVNLRRETRRRDHAPMGMSVLLPGDVATHVDSEDGAIELAHLVGNVTSRSLLRGNRITPLDNGDEAYPAMLEAVRGAQQSIVLLTYIFDNDSSGALFVEALTEAVERGVEVRVLIDAVGARYSHPPIHRVLKRKRIPVDLFLPSVVTRLPSFNLRNHRKIMVVDGRLGFTGGMNIREDFVASSSPRHPGRDLHFRLEGPVVAHLADVFAEDWEFVTGESLSGETWFPELAPVGPSAARGIVDGPDDDLDALNFTVLGAIACAQRSIRIVTPYFLPDPALVYALNTAALSGLDVDIVVPERGNLRLVTWAMWGQIQQMLRHGCRVWLSPPKPFDHSKLMVVDGYWVLFGSMNWDPRSLRLNFEFNVESYDKELAKTMEDFVRDRIQNARRLHAHEVKNRALPLRLRDGAARLLTPYL